MEPTNLQMQLDNFFILFMHYRPLATGESVNCLPLGSICRPGLFNNMNSTFLTNNSLGTSHVPDVSKDLGMQWQPEEALYLSFVPVVWGPGEGRNVVIKHSAPNVKLQTEVCDIKEKFCEDGRPEEAQSAHTSGIFGGWEGRTYV